MSGRHFSGENREALLAIVFVVLVVICAIAAPAISPWGPDAVSVNTDEDLAEAFAPPSLAHPFGRDALGRDSLSRMIWGARISLGIGAVVVTLTTFFGVVIGLLAGFFRGWVDELLMRFIDVLLAFPGILLAIGIIAVMGPGTAQTVFALCATGWVGYARLTRGLVLGEWGRHYIQASIAMGAHPFRTMFRHLLPNILSPLIVKATYGLAGVIMAEASLSFLGLGVQAPTPSWGSMLNEGTTYLILKEAWHLTLFPGLAIVLLILALNIIGELLRLKFDPKAVHTP